MNRYFIQYGNKIIDYRDAEDTEEALRSFISDLDIDTNILTEDECAEEYPEVYERHRLR